MKRKFRYKNIFMYASLQFCGHIDEYFIGNTEKLILYVINPRLRSTYNLLRIYKKGRLVKESRVWSSDNLFLYYLSWYMHQIHFLFKYFRRGERVILLSMHPIAFIGMNVVKLFRKISYMYWVGDYFPPTKISLRLFEMVKQYYHRKADHRYYLSDQINAIFNGKIVHDDKHRTVMWGVKPVHLHQALPRKKFTILFVGLMKSGQGLELMFSFLAKNKEYELKIIGISEKVLFQRYQSLIRHYHIDNQVFFPNTFYRDDELQSLARECHIGVAMYDTSKFNSSYYTDPGKVKSYIEMGLPVIMSKTSSIAQYVKRYHSGEVIKTTNEAIAHALERLRERYAWYQDGVKEFNSFFYYETYYREAFIAFEYL